MQEFFTDYLFIEDFILNPKEKFLEFWLSAGDLNHKEEL